MRCTRVDDRSRTIDFLTRRSIITAASLLLAFGCGDPYLHTNPYDPAVPVSIVVSGPDTLFSYNELGIFSALTTPPFPDSAVKYASSDSVAFVPSGPATFTSKAPPMYPHRP